MKIKQRKEADVKRAVQDYLKLRNFRWFRMQSGQIMGQHKGKPWMMRLCPPGTPDFLVLRPIRPDQMGSLAIWLEVKRPLGPRGGSGGSDQSPEQVEFQRAAEANGERYRVVRDIEGLINALSD